MSMPEDPSSGCRMCRESGLSTALFGNMLKTLFLDLINESGGVSDSTNRELLGVRVRRVGRVRRVACRLGGHTRCVGYRCLICVNNHIFSSFLSSAHCRRYKLPDTSVCVYTQVYLGSIPR